MAQLIEVSFKGNRKDFFLWDAENPPPLKAPVIVDADRGEDLGYVHATGEQARHRNAGTSHGTGERGPTQRAHRLATADDVRRGADLRAQDDDARRRAMERIRAHGLEMKLTDAEWQWDRKKLTLYFTADQRVDFRALVRELASMFRARIELKQIGVRDEAKRLDGIGRCGRQYCSSSWLPELRPVNLGVAKDQRLSLNPTQISGACGRLMCCLRYEHEFYVESRRRFPKEGRSLRTAHGDVKVLANDIFRERVTVRGDDGEVRIVALADLRAEIETAGLPFPTPAAGVTSERESRESDEHFFAPAMDAGARPVVEDGEADEAGEMRFVTEEMAIPRLVLGELAVEELVREESAAEGEDEEPLATVVPESADDDAGDRRPARRRGRRGGRRNRPSGGRRVTDEPPATGAAEKPPPEET